MEQTELIRRCLDLAARCEKSGCVTASHFLTPAEQYELKRQSGLFSQVKMLFHGGNGECERKAAFFLPWYMEEEEAELCEYIRAVELTAAFGAPGHRDYLGAAMGLGIKREWLGDVWVKDNKAVIFCLKSVESHILLNLEKVGRCGVKPRPLALEEVEAPKREMKETVFTVKSLRLDAVAAGMFGISRSSAADIIARGELSLNYAQCLKCDAPIREGDVISLRGRGKGTVAEIGGRSRKDRIYVKCGIYK